MLQTHDKAHSAGCRGHEDRSTTENPKLFLPVLCGRASVSGGGWSCQLRAKPLHTQFSGALLSPNPGVEPDFPFALSRWSSFWSSARPANPPPNPLPSSPEEPGPPQVPNININQQQPVHTGSFTWFGRLTTSSPIKGHGDGQKPAVRRCTEGTPLPTAPCSRAVY